MGEESCRRSAGRSHDLWLGRYLIRFVSLAAVLIFLPAAAVQNVEQSANGSVSVWFADHTTLYGVDAETNQLIRSIPLPYEASAIAPDPNDGSVWVLAHKHLLKFDAASGLILDLDLKSLPTKLDDPDNLILNPYDSSVWITADKTLLHLNRDGQLLSAWDSPGKIQVFILGLDESPWLLTNEELIRLSPSGSIQQSLAVKKTFHDPEFMIVDSLGGKLWLADHSQLIQFNISDLSQSSTTVYKAATKEGGGGQEETQKTKEDKADNEDAGRKISGLALDPLTGVLWLTTKTKLLGLDRSGSLTNSTDLPTGLKESEALVFDASGHGLWLGGKKVVAHFANSGQLLATISVANEIEAIASVPLGLVPQITLLSPAQGGLTNDITPQIRFGLSGVCNGAVCDAGQNYLGSLRLSVILNGQSVSDRFIVSGGQASYLPAERLPEGINSITANATDTFGRVSSTITGSFTIDSIPPVIRLEAPSQTMMRIADQILSGDVSEDATLTINGQHAPLDAEKKFSYPVTLKEGPNAFELAATDLAGNTTRRTITLTLDTVPPRFLTLSPADGSLVASPNVVIEGSVDDATATVTLEDMPAFGGEVVSDNPSAFGFKAKLGPGLNTLTLAAQDPAGNIARASLRLTYSTGSIKVTNLSPGQNIEGNHTLVTGTFEGPSNTGITVNGVVAQTFGNQFYVNNLPLKPGDNMITVVANTLDGEIGRHSFTITSDGGVRLGVERVTSRLANLATIAGTGNYGFSGDGGPAVGARLSVPGGIAPGADGSLYVADVYNSRIRRIAPDGSIVTVAGNGYHDYQGDGGAATQAALNNPWDVSVGADGSLYIADTYNSVIRRVDTNGIITTVAGTGISGDAGDGGPANQAQLVSPTGIALGENGAIYIADSDSHRIRRVDAAGVISTVAGTGELGDAGDGGPAVNAQLAYPGDIAVASDGTLYVADCGNGRIRRIAPNGIITTVAGSGTLGFGGDGGQAVQAQLSCPASIAVGADQSLYIADADNNRIRRVNSQGIITTVAGTGDYGLDCRGGPPTQTPISYPLGVALDAAGTLYIADSYNYCVRALTTISTSGDQAPLLAAFRINNPTGVLIQRIEADFDGDGVNDLVTTNPEAPLEHRYDDPGAYTARFTVTDDTGAVHTASYVVVIDDVNATDTMLRAVYTTMLDRLRVGNVEGALNAVTGGVRAKYETVFNTLKPDLSVIVDQLGTLKGGAVGEEMAEYVLVRNQAGQPKAFLIYLLRGEDGVWRIDGM